MAACESDHLTKTLERTLFYRHVDYIMGHIPPMYSPCHEQSTGKLPILPASGLTTDAAKCSVDASPWVYIVMSTIMTVQSILDFIPQWILGGY